MQKCFRNNIFPYFSIFHNFPYIFSFTNSFQMVSLLGQYSNDHKHIDIKFYT